MSTEETALRFLRAAVAAQFHKNGSFEPLLWNSAIVAMRISTGAPRRSRGRYKVFGQFRPKTLHLNKAGNLESQGFQGFRLCSVRITIALSNPVILFLDKNQRFLSRKRIKLIFLQLKPNRHTALTAHGTSEQRQIPISTLHRVNGGGRQRLPFHHSVSENISVHIREGGNITLS